jgi:hypothetical protein
MWRILLALVLVGLWQHPAPVAAQSDCLGEAVSPEDAASVLFAEYLAGGQWELAYEMLHPDAQLRVLRQAFSAARQARSRVGPLLDVEVFPARTAPAWVWGVSGGRFTDVAEVPVRFVHGRGFFVQPTVEIVPLVRVNGCWRWLPPTLP